MSSINTSSPNSLPNFWSSYKKYRRSRRLQLILAVIGGGIWLAAGLLFRWLWGDIGSMAATAMILVIVFFLAANFSAVLYTMDDRYLNDEYNHQALLGIYTSLSPKTPLPYFRNHALSADTGVEYIRLIKRLKPNLIVELGSGTSSIIAGYVVKQNGKGRVIAIDHEEVWGSLTQQYLNDHEVRDYVEVRIAPLVKNSINQVSYNWYDPRSVQDIEKIDILLIDGPPDIGGLGARYPALLLLGHLISDNGYIVVDDCVRPKWKKMVLDWAAENEFLVEEPFNNEKNALLLRRNIRGKDTT